MKNNTNKAVAIVLAIVMCIGLVTDYLMTFDVYQDAKQVRKEREQEDEPIYKVISVYRYNYTITNAYGAAIGQEVCYYFEYLDEEGNLLAVEQFVNSEYGRQRIALSNDYDKYTTIGGIEYLYLTEETLKNIKQD